MFFESFCLFKKNFVTVKVGHLTSDVVLFSVVAFKKIKTLDISQGSIATHLSVMGSLVIALLQIFS